MKVILLQELKGKGVEGDVVDVAGGYADNYLLPNRIAVKATKGNLKQLEQRRHNIEAREVERTAAAERMRETLDGAAVNIEARVGDEGQLFGSVTPQIIAEALKEQFGLEVDRRLIDVKGAIKTAGEHEAVVSLHKDVKAALKLVVGSAEDIAAAQVAAGQAEADETEDAADEVAEDAEEAVEAAPEDAEEADEA